MAVFNITENLKVHGTITDSVGKIVFGGVEVSKNSAAAVGTRKTLNLIEGSNITLTIVDDPGGDEIDVTIAAAGTVFEAFDIQQTVVTDDTSTTGLADVVNVTEAGKLISVGMIVTGNLSGNVISTLDITIDGGTTRTILVYNNSTAWNRTTMGYHQLGERTVQGAIAADHLLMNFGGMRYATSLKISHNITTANASGELSLAAIRGERL